MPSNRRLSDGERVSCPNQNIEVVCSTLLFFDCLFLHHYHREIGAKISMLTPFCRLQPLLTEIKKDRTSVPMAELDYINYNTLQYEFYSDHTVRYGFDWRLIIFETFFRVDQIGLTPQSPRP